MTDEKTKAGAESGYSDPFQAWRTFYQTSEKNWEAFFHEVLSTDTFADALGRTLQGYLNTQGAFAKALERSMEQYLKAINVPSRADITRIAGMIVALEDKVDEIASIVEQLEHVPTALKRIDGDVSSIMTRTAGLAGIKRELDRVNQAAGDVAVQLSEFREMLQREVAQQQAEQQHVLDQIAELRQALHQVIERQQALQQMAEQLRVLQEVRQGLDELRTLVLEQGQRSAAVADDGATTAAPEAGSVAENGARRPTRRRATADTNAPREIEENA